MDALKSSLLSIVNINYISQLIVSDFKISQKAMEKCRKIIKSNFIYYLDHVDGPPENDQELRDAIKYLNKKCYDDFEQYLRSKYPNEEITRKSSEKNINSFELSDSNPNLNIPTTIPLESNMNLGSVPQPEIETQKEKANTEIQEIVILSQEELETYGITSIGDQMLQFLLNPNIILFFLEIVKQVKEPMHFDQILKKDEVDKLLEQPIERTSGIKPLTKPLETENNPTKIDSNETLMTASQRLSDINKIKSTTSDPIQLDSLNNEKANIIESIKGFKETLNKLKEDNEKKIKSLTTNVKATDNDLIDILDLEFDPTGNYNDLKNIVIRNLSEKKVTKIKLKSYELPKNKNNITRFNNLFSVYFGSRRYAFNIDPGYYTIQELLDYIRERADYLEIDLKPDGIINISHKSNIKFDLMIDNDTIFNLLGFTGKINQYRQKIFYTAVQPYTINPNSSVYFTSSSSQRDPMLMEDGPVDTDIILKQSKAGIVMKQIRINLTDGLNQIYDFTTKFRMMFEIEYLAD